MPLDNPYDRFGYDVPDALMESLIFHESSGNSEAKSKVGAVGLTQLMPGTAKEMGVTDRKDPYQSMEGGKKYLKKYVDKYDGDYEKALIAYNWGPGNVARKGAENAPEESKAYARKVLAKAGMGPKPKPVTGFETAAADDMNAAVKKYDTEYAKGQDQPPAGKLNPSAGWGQSRYVPKLPKAATESDPDVERNRAFGSGILEGALGLGSEPEGSVMDPEVRRRRKAYDIGEGIGIAAQVPMIIGPGKFIKGAKELPGKILEELSAHPSGSRAAQEGIIKPVGGQWLTHNLQPAFDEIKHKTAGGTPYHKGMLDELTKPGGVWEDQEAHKMELDQTHKAVALNDWIDSTMMGYVKKRMGTEKDEIRKLADQGVVHEDLGGEWGDESGVGSETAMNRVKAGFPEGGVATTETGKRWENLSDANIVPSKAGTWQGHAPRRTEGPLKKDLEALKKAPPDATVYNVADYFSPQSLGFDHIVDVIEGDLNSGRLRPDNLNKFTMEAAVRRTHEVDQAAIKAVQADKAALLPKIQEHNAKLTPYASYPTPEGNVNWYKYDKTVDPEDIAYGLSVDSQFMEHCVGGVGHGEAGYKGYVPMRNLQTGKPVAAKYPKFNDYANDVKNGNAEIFSLRNEKGEPVATIKVGNTGDMPFSNIDRSYDLYENVMRYADPREFRRTLKKEGIGANDFYNGWREDVGGKYIDQDSSVELGEELLQLISPTGYKKYLAEIEELLRNPSQSVNEIKGPNNGKVDPKYQPMINDFLKKGEYTFIDDLDNTGLIQIGEDQGGKPEFVTEGEMDNAWQKAYGTELPGDVREPSMNYQRLVSGSVKNRSAADKKFLALVAAAAAGTASAAEQQGTPKVASDNPYDQFDKENPYAQFDEGVGEDYAPKIDPQTGKQFDPEIPTRMALAQNKAKAAETKSRDEKLSRKRGLGARLVDELSGAGETAMTLGSGLAAGAVANPVGVVQSLAEGDGGKAEQKASEFMQSVTYQPRSDAGKRNVEAIGEAFDKSKLAGIAPELSEVSNVGGAVRPALRQISEAVAPGGRQALKEASVSVGRDVLSWAGRPVAPAGFEKPWKSGMISPQAAELAQKAEDMGIKVPLHALVDNKLVKMLGGFLSDITGGNETKNKAAFNDYLSEAIGAEKRGALTYGKEGNFEPAMKFNGKRIGDVYAATDIPMAGQLDSSLDKLAAKMEARPGDSPRVVGGFIQNLRELSDKHNGVIPGEVMQQFNTDLGDEIRRLDGVGDIGLVQDGLVDLRETINDSVLRNASPELKKQFQDARKKYAIGSKLKTLVAKAQLSGVTPKDLLGVITQSQGGKHRMAMGVDDVLGSAAAVAQNFMKEEGAMLNAPERRLALGAAGLGSMALPAILPKVGGAIGGSLLYNRYGPKVAKRVIERSLPPKAIEDSALTKSPRELSTEPSAFTSKPQAPTPEPKVRPTLELADKGHIPGHGVPDSKLLAKRHDIPERTVDFPLRQEVIEKLGPTIDTFREEHARLTEALADPKTPAGTKTKMRVSLNALEKRFLDGAKKLGANSAADMHGLRRLLYEGTNRRTKLPVEHTFNPKEARP